MQKRMVPNGQGKNSSVNRFSVLSEPLAKSDFHAVSSRNKARKSRKSKSKSSNQGFQLAFWNAQSLRQKTQLVNDLMVEHDIDLFMFTESWLKNEDVFEIGELTNNGIYQFINSPRTNRPGGGVACLFKTGLNVCKIQSDPYKTFEHMILKLKTYNKSVKLAVIYRPESTSKNKYTMSEIL